MSINMSNTGCKKCNEKNSLPVKPWLLIVSLYFTFSAIYGTIKIVENILNIF
jgi:hypothetical protein